jgi:probable DNA metabolism protein
MHCVFDGSFDGLMTLVFDTYLFRDNIDAVSESNGVDSLLPTQYFPANPDKARRIKAYIKKKLGEDFAFMARTAYLSNRETRFRSIVKTIHLSCSMGKAVLDLLDDEILNFIACQREVKWESHRFMGILRFKQMHDDSMLAVFAPRHNVLTLVLPHFADRFPDQHLLLYDEQRHIAGLSGKGKLRFVEVERIAPQESLQEAELQNLWRVFFDKLAIRERFNPRLQQQHLPKYTWKNLTEMQ